MDEIQLEIREKPSAQRRYLRAPIPEIGLAACLLDCAVTAHLLGHRVSAESLINMADMPEIRQWIESVWGKASPYVQYRPVPDGPAKLDSDLRTKLRMPSYAEKRTLLRRDGYHCRFCAIPLIRPEIRNLLRMYYPNALRWGKTDASKHAAFLALWLQYDHILPHARGGNNDIENLVITCAACNYGRMSYTLAEVGLQDPRSREPFRSTWDGLERLLSVTHRPIPLELTEEEVNPELEHFELRFGPSGESWSDALPVALIGSPNDGIVNVQLLLEQQDEAVTGLVEKVWQEIRFFLCELNEGDAWAYAQYHCGTAANAYSDLHWSYFKPAM